MGIIKLKRTKRKPSPGFDIEEGKVYYKYLYTNTGLVSDWAVAVNMAIEKGRKPPDVIEVELKSLGTEDNSEAQRRLNINKKGGREGQ